MQNKPHVLMVDDEPETVAGMLASVAEVLSFEVLEPNEVGITHLQRADLVLVDHFLNSWLSRYDSSPSKRPRHGIALAATLQSYVDGLEDQSGRRPLGTPTAFALVSAHLQLVGGRLPDDVREHAIARLHNLEWAFDKNERKQFGPQVLQLAEAVRTVPRALQGGEADRGRQALHDLLKLPSDEPWTGQAIADVFDCHPPILELAQASKGLAVVRWLLHRILPYPTFLLNQFELAARLGIDISYIELMTVQAGLFRDVMYRGALDSFSGPRWWRAGVEQAIWDLTDGRRKTIEEAVRGVVGESVKVVNYRTPVVVLDCEYHPIALIDADQAVRVQPDDWPPYADSAWMAVDQVRDNPHLTAIVLDDDRERLEGGK